MNAGILYIVATPIGNLGDLTLRAIDVLKQCSCIAAEDTRRSRQLLSHLGIEGKSLVALHAHSNVRDVARLVARLEAGESVALVTDAGTPVVSDPGDALVKAAVAAQVAIVPVPGPSAVLAALVGSGLSTGAGFRFVGFLPRDGAARRDAVALVCATPETVILFESPERTTATLTELAHAMPERKACVARELTKIHEQFVRGTLGSLAAQHDAATGEGWRGEIAIVLGSWSRASGTETMTDEEVDRRIDQELDAGTHVKTLADAIAAWSGRARREVYERAIRRKAQRRSDGG